MRIGSLLFILATLFSACSTAFDLNGTWEARGYECPHEVIETEIVKIEQNGIDIVATKVKGDQCIRDGEITFEGQIKGKVLSGFMNGRNPYGSEEIRYPMDMDIISNDALVLKLENGRTIGFSRITASE